MNFYKKIVYSHFILFENQINGYFV